MMGLDSGSSSSEETGDQDHQKVVSENAIPASRFYECTYCKRGFTNAQALGGHMNIHRKEKAQAKKLKSANKRQPRKSDEDLANCSSSTVQNHEVPGDHHQHMNGNYIYQQHYFFPVPGSNPSYDHGDLGHVNEDRGEESEVDLELRLGLTL